METFIGILIIPWVFITLLVTLIILELISTSKDKFLWNTILVILIIALIHVNYHVLEHLLEHPLQWAFYIVGYIATGVIWSFIKWYSKIQTHVRKIKKIKKERGDEWNNPEFKNSIKSEISLYGYGNDDYTLDEIIKKSFPDLTEHKMIISNWIMYWPFSLVATLLDDPIRRLANYLFEVFSGVYAKIKSNAIESI